MIVKGQFVKYLFDTGARGLAYIYGIVEKAGPKTFTVRWPSGIHNRVRQGDRDVTLLTEPELIEIAKKDLRL